MSDIEPVNPIQQPTTAEPVSGETKTKDTRSVSSLSKSQQEDVMQVLLAYAYQPVLISPNWNVSPDVSIKGIIAAVDTKIGDIGTRMWDDYLKNLHAISDEIAERIRSPQYQQIQEIGKKTIERNENLLSGVTDFVNRHKDEAEAIPFMTMALVVAGGMIGNSINVVNTVSSPLVAAKPIVDASQVAVQVLPAALADPAVMTINLMLPAMLYSTAFFVVNAGGKGEKQVDLEFARAFAKNIIQKVKNDEIGQFLTAMLANQTFTKEQLNQASNTTKLIMLSIALGLFYKVETGWLTGQEFAAFIKNNPYKEGTVEYDIIEMIKQTLKSLPPEESAATLEHLMAYFDGNPDVDELLSPEKVFSKIYPPFKRDIEAV